MNIAIVGTGYVGLVAATCFADAGNHLICVDSNLEKLKCLRGGRAPFYEPGLDELLAKNSSRMEFVDGIGDAISKASIVFVAVGTPELPDGSADMEPTFRVLQEICRTAVRPLFVVLKSTVPIGTAKQATEFCKTHSRFAIEIVSNPEFLRQGSALGDFLKPDRVVIGCSSDAARQVMTELYRPFLSMVEQIMFMDNTSAEMVKYAANSFLALKISFINELAILAGRLGADINRVRDGFTSDHRINPAFFNPGIGYGGSCFPKDVHALLHTGKQVDLDLKLLRAADEVNERQKGLLTDYLVHRFGRLDGKKIALWGLAFKPRTDDVRRAPSLQIIERLVELGAAVSTFDPVATANAKAACKAPFLSADTPLEAAREADALLIVTEWPEFKTVDVNELRTAMNHPIVFDGRNILDPRQMSAAGFEYYGIGRQAFPTESLRHQRSYFEDSATKSLDTSS